jgi:hypothetical protein
MKTESDENNSWPQDELDLDLLSGAVESGCDLYAFGSFGGFGGRIWSPIFKEFKDAVAWHKERESGVRVDLFRIKAEVCREFEEFR